jgi:hypothetical protein
LLIWLRFEKRETIMWKPMTNAPKGGTRILLFAIAAIGGGPKPAPVVGYWSPHRDGWVDAIISSGVSRPEVEVIPTAWMEIPEFELAGG